MVSAFNLFVFFLISTIANVKDQSLIPTTSIIFPAMLAVFVHRINVFISNISNVVWSSLSLLKLLWVGSVPLGRVWLPLPHCSGCIVVEYKLLTLCFEFLWEKNEVKNVNVNTRIKPLPSTVFSCRQRF